MTEKWWGVFHVHLYKLWKPLTAGFTKRQNNLTQRHGKVQCLVSHTQSMQHNSSNQYSNKTIPCFYYLWPSTHAESGEGVDPRAAPVQIGSPDHLCVFWTPHFDLKTLHLPSWSSMRPSLELPTPARRSLAPGGGGAHASTPVMSQLPSGKQSTANTCHNRTSR